MPDNNIVAIMTATKDTSEPAPPILFGETLGNTVVKIQVGIEKKIFTVHKDLLCKKVPFFDKMFNGQFIEGQTQSAELPEVDSKTFQFFLGWVYRGVLEPLEDSLDDCFGTCSRLFAFADTYYITDLADMVMDSMCKSFEAEDSVPTFWGLTGAFKLTHMDSKFDLFLVRAMVYNSCREDSEDASSRDLLDLIKTDDDLALKFLTLLRKQMQKGASNIQPPSEFPPCDYHQHTKDERCPYMEKRMYSRADIPAGAYEFSIVTR